MTIFIETDRLILRELLPTDVDGLFELDSNPLVHRYLGNNPLTHRDQATEVIKFVRKQYVENGIGRWAVIEKQSGNFIGWSGLKIESQKTNNHVNYVDLGYRLIPKYWGKGYATESALAAVKYGFETMNYDEICGAADCDNLGSNKVLEKVGLKFVETFLYEGIPCNWYALNRRDYEAKRNL